MQTGHKLQFQCEDCESPVVFSVLDREHFRSLVVCSYCGKKYAFDDETLLQHLYQFESLCREIHSAKDILGKTAIAIDVGSHHVKVPFNILLTRLSSVMELNMNGKKVDIAFRVEPLKDVPEALAEQSCSR